MSIAYRLDNVVADIKSYRLFHFALFISACRYTHAQRYGAASNHAKAVTDEATEIARKMIADMTGPNGTFRPISRRQQQTMPESTPLMEQQPTTSGSSFQLPQRRYEPMIPGSSAVGGSSLATDRSPPEIMVESPSDTHPALRANRDDGHIV